MEILKPATPQDLAGALASAAAAGHSIRLGGRFTKDAMGGPLPPRGATISTAGLNRVLRYDPGDLTISVEAGLPYAELETVLAAHRQMLPLDPPFAADATVGGVVASNASGPRRRLHGTARDFVIGMHFATLEGKLVRTGGMVVKNVAGLDMAKLMIGSFGTLAAIAVVNFKVVPMPETTRTFLLRHESAEAALAQRDAILAGVLQPSAVDLLNPAAAARLGLEGFMLAVRAGGNAAVVERYARELAGAAALEGPQEDTFWERVREFAPAYLSENPEGAVVRVSCLLTGVRAVLEALSVPAVARAGSGVCYCCFPDCGSAAAWIRDAKPAGARAVIEYAPPARKEALELWPEPGGDLAWMQKIKQMFDPNNLLNRGRLYGRI